MMETDTIWQRTFMSKQPMADVPESEQPADDDLARSALIDPVQFAFLYRRYVTRVYRYFYGRVGNAGDAEDLTAQLFLELVQSTFTANSGRSFHWNWQKWWRAMSTHWGP